MSDHVTIGVTEQIQRAVAEPGHRFTVDGITFVAVEPDPGVSLAAVDWTAIEVGRGITFWPLWCWPDLRVKLYARKRDRRRIRMARKRRRGWA